MLCRFLIFTVLCNCLLEIAYCDESGNFFLKVSKSVPRIGKRGNKGSPEFEKFFLKASKSVPRIGRRNENPFENQNEVDGDYTQTKIKYPTWPELAVRDEYDPELFSSPQLLKKLEEEMGDDPTLYDWDKVRLRRNTPGQNQRFFN